MYVYIYIYIYRIIVGSGGTKRATLVNTPLLRLRSSERKLISRNRARAQVLLQARKWHVYESGTFGAFRSWVMVSEP